MFKDSEELCAGDFCLQGDQLLKLISFIDLTTLNSDDTNDVVRRLIDKAVLPYSVVR